MGIVVEYAGRSGKPQWIAPPSFRWSYALFAKPGTSALQPDETFEMTFAKDNAADDGFNRWTINGVAFPIDGMFGKMVPATLHLKQGKRYRLRMLNASDDIHPIHLHRHTFELTNLSETSTVDPLAGSPIFLSLTNAYSSETRARDRIRRQFPFVAMAR
jgi:FtsP/CotA-like multicopper oxidase with cupredoxin domain